MKIKLKIIIYLVFIFILSACTPTSKNENIVYENLSPIEVLKDTWKISGTGEITWTVKENNHVDHIEMSGLRVSGIIHYGIDENGMLVLKKKIVWPMLRTIPNDTHASLIHDFDERISPQIVIDNKVVENEKTTQFMLNGILSIRSKVNPGVDIVREVFPSTTDAALLELITIENNTKKPIKAEIKNLAYTTQTKAEKGVYGTYTIEANTAGFSETTIRAGEKKLATVSYTATKEGEKIALTGNEEKTKREVFVQSLYNSLVLESPDTVVNEMFRFAKIRTTESIYATKGGLMHGPGGSRYYAAIWANDQAEYVNPFFPFLGNNNGNESAINSFRHFARFINPDYKPIPSSIIAEGVDIWNGAGDRGDAAMIAYGASRFALAYSNKETAKELLPLIKWSLEYCELQMLPEGVIASDSDELEGRFPSGNANLSTNMLAYGGYLSAANLLAALNSEPELVEAYRAKAEKLKENSEAYFGGNVMGFDTYKYFKENNKLRSWICLPLTMGIFDRKEETLKALFSPQLWNPNGIYTEAGNKTFWDRSTLYAFKGILYAGETDLAMEYLKYYSQKRLLGEHVPYAVEAWPEGGQRHLSAESGLYCRVITEGLFGIEPTGLKSFTCSPKLPSDWDYMKLKNIKAFGNIFDLEAEKFRNKTKVTIELNGQVFEEKMWNGEGKLEFRF
ncbi:MAG: hypothetical protein ABFS35_22990 [Bacteroidota bacterium]